MKTEPTNFSRSKTPPGQAPLDQNTQHRPSQPQSTPLGMNSGTYKPRAAIHWARRIWHVLGVLAIALIYQAVNYPSALILLVFALLIFALPDFLRLHIPRLNQFVLKWFRPILRESEVNALSGVTYLFLGIFIITTLFPRSIVELSLLMLAFGDPAATIFGVRFGKDKIWRNKSLQGACAAFLVCTLVSYVYFLYNNVMAERAILVALITGLIGAVSEVIPLGKWDDNFSFPIYSSTLLWFLFMTFGGFA
ncbi:MAG: diacylglycerol/polyprenol kinase family protein [Bdellovibrionales bacterium]